MAGGAHGHAQPDPALRPDDADPGPDAADPWLGAPEGGGSEPCWAYSSGASAGVLGRRDGMVTRQEALDRAGAISRRKGNRRPPRFAGRCRTDHPDRLAERSNWSDYRTARFCV